MQAKSHRYYLHLNQYLIAYTLLHITCKIGFKRLENGYKYFQPFRFAKYGVFAGWIYGYYWVANWFIKELKNTDIYEYKTARARLYKDMNIAKRMWTYGQERALAMQNKAND